MFACWRLWCAMGVVFRLRRLVVVKSPGVRLLITEFEVRRCAAGGLA
jgi:hypothetical protein